MVNWQFQICAHIGNGFAVRSYNFFFFLNFFSSCFNRFQFGFFNVGRIIAFAAENNFIFAAACNYGKFMRTAAADSAGPWMFSELCSLFC